MTEYEIQKCEHEFCFIARREAVEIFCGKCQAVYRGGGHGTVTFTTGPDKTYAEVRLRTVGDTGPLA